MKMVIELDPDNAEAWFNKAWILGELNRYQEAIDAYDKVLKSMISMLMQCLTRPISWKDKVNMKKL